MTERMDKEGGSPAQGLKRELGLFSAISMIVAVMIGSGIFVSPSSALEHSGSIGLSLIVWMVCGILSLLGALAFAELSAVVPKSGAEYAYFLDAFGPLHRYFGELPAFLYSWVFVFVLRPAEVAVIVLTFAEYFVQPLVPLVGELDAHNWTLLKKLVGSLALGLMVYINITSVKLYVKVQNTFGVFKILACILVIVGGCWWLATGHTDLLSEPFKGTTSSPGQIALAFYSGLWAYDGWTAAAIVTEEVKRPEVNILRSILVAVPVVTVLYVSMNLMYMSALTTTEMIGAPAVAVLWAERILPSWMGFAIPLGVALSTFGCGLSVQFGVTRLCYVAGREGHVPRFFSWVHHERLTPAAAVALQGALTLLYMMLGNIVELIEFASFLIWVSYGLAMLALIVMRYTKPDVQRPYRVPTFVPWLVLLISVYLSLMPIYEDPSLKYMFVLVFVLLGWVVYHFYVHQKKKSDFTRKLTYLVQMLFMVVAPDEVEDKSDEALNDKSNQVK
ncbi:b(0,+)-type amino acid transporter 1-like [Copidosoma floridanum]|uniref:b(0,+)-type amino acid transporter 1-like n=1 Tax=Copidosoma floridanum TaxID=29053 RepID=UPI0006C9B084|nr:b(0,+)-type amino acid transporter 1-like [Copidosoma floridanum]